MRAMVCFFLIFSSLVKAGDPIVLGKSSTYNSYTIFGTSSLLRTGAFSLGVEPIFYLKGQDKFGFVGHVKYGLVPRFELLGDIGVQRGETYFAGGIEYSVLQDGGHGPGLSCRGSAFGNGGTSGVDMILNLSNKFSQITLYGAFDYRLLLEDNTDDLIYLVPGIRIPLRKNMSFMTEFGLNMNAGGNNSYVSGGLSFTF